MQDSYKILRPWLESWGAWSRIKLIIDFPIESVSCNPDLHTASALIEPSFKMPVYCESMTPEENNRRLRKHERSLREYHHIKRTESKVKRVAQAPDYNPHWRMNIIDNKVAILPDILKEVITLRYMKELKGFEIKELIGRSLAAINKRFALAYEELSDIPTLVITRENYTMTDRKYRNGAIG